VVSKELKRVFILIGGNFAAPSKDICKLRNEKAAAFIQLYCRLRWWHIEIQRQPKSQESIRATSLPLYGYQALLVEYREKYENFVVQGGVDFLVSP
jgi:hypothetical protein